MRWKDVGWGAACGALIPGSSLMPTSVGCGLALLVLGGVSTGVASSVGRGRASRGWVVCAALGGAWLAVSAGASVPGLEPAVRGVVAASWPTTVVSTVGAAFVLAGVLVAGLRWAGRGARAWWAAPMVVAGVVLLWELISRAGLAWWWFSPNAALASGMWRAWVWLAGPWGALALALACGGVLGSLLSGRRWRALAAVVLAGAVVLGGAAWLHEHALGSRIAVVGIGGGDGVRVVLDRDGPGLEHPPRGRVDAWVLGEGLVSVEDVVRRPGLDRAFGRVGAAVRTADDGSFGAWWSSGRRVRTRAKTVRLPLLDRAMAPGGAMGWGAWAVSAEGFFDRVVLCSEAAYAGAHGSGAVVAHSGSLTVFAEPWRGWAARVDLRHRQVRSAESASVSFAAVSGGVSGVVGATGRELFSYGDGWLDRVDVRLRVPGGLAEIPVRTTPWEWMGRAFTRRGRVRRSTMRASEPRLRGPSKRP